MRKGSDPSAAKRAARQALTVKELRTQLIEEYSKSRNKPRTVESDEGCIQRHIIPELGRIKMPDLTRAEVTALVRRMSHAPVTANRTLAGRRHSEPARESRDESVPPARAGRCRQRQEPGRARRRREARAAGGKQVLQRLVGLGFRNHDIVILTYRGVRNSVLSELDAVGCAFVGGAASANTPMATR